MKNTVQIYSKKMFYNILIDRKYYLKTKIINNKSDKKMKEEQLKRGNELQKLIREHKEALLCFEFENGETREPRLIIEYDDYDMDL